MSTSTLQQPTPERAQELAHNFQVIQHEVDSATVDRLATRKPRLVAVSKVKPSSDLLALYEIGVRHFGENYPQELVEKAALLPIDIQWHFIGALQSNKAKMLASIPNLFAIETLTSIKSADVLEKTRASLHPTPAPLNVFIQINTSSESAKSGLLPLEPSSPNPESMEVVLLAHHLLQNCPSLRLRGIMTIGSFAASTSDAINPDFVTLKQTRELLLEVLERSENAATRSGLEEIKKEGGLELSMGMSEDFVKAIEAGSTNVRVGSRIFGARPPRS